MNKPQILVVEDDTAVGNLITTTLETQNYLFHRAKTGAGALMDALSYRPDVILLDLGLPDMDGVTLFKKSAPGAICPSLSSPPAARTATRSPPWTPAPMTISPSPSPWRSCWPGFGSPLRGLGYDTQKTDQEPASTKTAR